MSISFFSMVLHSSRNHERLIWKNGTTVVGGNPSKRLERDACHRAIVVVSFFLLRSIVF